MKTIGTIFFLLWMSFYVSAQPAVDPATGLPVGANANLTGEFSIDPATGLPISGNSNVTGEFSIDPATGLPINRNANFAKQSQGLDKMAEESDLVLKGRVISTHAETIAAFPDWGNPFATEFEVISVLKGSVNTNKITFQHITEQPGGWGGGTIPSQYFFEVGKSYIIFAGNSDRPDYLYSPSADNILNSYEFRQPMRGEYAYRTLDSSALGSLAIKEAVWIELGRLLNSGIATNSLYAIQQLNRMSMACGISWEHSDDFKRVAVLQAVLPLVTNANEQVAVAAIGCFEVGGNHLDFVGDSYGWMTMEHECSGFQPECIAQVLPYADALAAVANSSPSSLRRVAAIAALSCAQFLIVSNSLPRWLTDPAPEVRAQAVLLLPDFPGEFCERLLQERAADTSPVVRAAVADAIGNGKIEALLPTLGTLFSTSPVRTNSGPWPHKGLQGGGYFAEVGADDIHTSVL
jgi:HEAT repeat associated with sister chromatid cohesion